MDMSKNHARYEKQHNSDSREENIYRRRSSISYFKQSIDHKKSQMEIAQDMVNDYKIKIEGINNVLDNMETFPASTPQMKILDRKLGGRTPGSGGRKS